MEYKRKIFGYECDVYGHLNNAIYLHIYEEARSDALDQMEMSIQKLNEKNIGIFLINVELEFIKAISLGENIIVRTYIIESTRLRATWKQEIFNSENELCNRAIVKGVFIRDNKPSRLPKEIVEHFNQFIVHTS